MSTAFGFTASARRLLGYRQALAAAGLAADDSLIRLGPHGPASAQALATGLLELPDPPSAIFAASDTQAMGVLAAADQSGASVPYQLSVIGFDDIQSAALLGLSTVRQPLEDSGAQGAERLCALLRGESVRPQRQVMELQVMPRASSARAGSSRVAGSPERGPRGRDRAADASGPGRRPAHRAAGRPQCTATRAAACPAGPAGREAAVTATRAAACPAGRLAAPDPARGRRTAKARRAARTTGAPRGPSPSPTSSPSRTAGTAGPATPALPAPPAARHPPASRSMPPHGTRLIHGNHRHRD